MGFSSSVTTSNKFFVVLVLFFCFVSSESPTQQLEKFYRGWAQANCSSIKELLSDSFVLMINAPNVVLNKSSVIVQCQEGGPNSFLFNLDRSYDLSKDYGSSMVLGADLLPNRIANASAPCIVPFYYQVSILLDGNGKIDRLWQSGNKTTYCDYFEMCKTSTSTTADLCASLNKKKVEPNVQHAYAAERFVQSIWLNQWSLVQQFITPDFVWQDGYASPALNASALQR